MDTADIASVCKALGDPNRLEIVRRLSDGEKCACKLLEAFEITQPTLSHHMHILCSCGLIRTRKDGKCNFYSLNRETLQGLAQFLEKLERTAEPDAGCSGCSFAG